MATWTKVVTESASGEIAQSAAGLTATLVATKGGTGQGSVTKGDILYGSAADTISKLAISTAGKVLKVSSGGVVEWATDTSGSGTVTSVGTNTGLSGTVTTSGSLSLALDDLADMTASWVTGTDEFIVLDDGVQSKKLSSEIFGSNAFNSTAFTTNTGTVTSVTMAGDSGSTAITGAGTFTIAGGEGIDTAESGGTVTIKGENASTSNLGIASFSSDNFAVSSGVVTIKDSGVILGTESTGNYVSTAVAGDGIDVSGATGDVTITAEDSTASNKGIVIVAGGTNASVDYASGTATVKVDDAFIKNNASDSSSGTITAAGFTTSGTVSCATMSVSGTITHTNTEQLDIEDSVLVLNSGLSGSTAKDAAIFVERDTANDKGSVNNDMNPSIYWDESTGYWGFAEHASGGGDIATNPITPHSYMCVASVGSGTYPDGGDEFSPVGSIHIDDGAAMYVRMA